MRKINEIANEIKLDWKNVYFGAVPYLEAMSQLETPSDRYGMDTAESIVMYFLANATRWKGETAKRIKLELKQIFK